MKKMLKKSLAVLLALICMMNVAVFTASAAVMANGAYGNNPEGDIKWTLDSDGTLTIKGNGEMEDMYNYYNWTGDYASSIKKVVIEKGITRIGDNAFSGTMTYTTEHDYTWCCENLEAIQIPDGVTSIGDCAFAYAAKLKGVKLPGSVKTIGILAFGHCKSLNFVVFPEKISEIQDGAFLDCGNLKEVYYKGTKAQWNKIAIGSGNEDLTVANLYCKVDLNNDDKANSADALLVLQHAVKIKDLDSKLHLDADANGDGKINSADALMILKYAVNI